MSNVDRIAGFKPVRHLNGNPWNGKARMYYVRSDYAVALFIGDAGISGGSSDASGKYATIQQATAGSVNVRGVIIGFSDQPFAAFDATNLYRTYKPASTEMYALVVDDPDVIFEIQEDNDANDMDADMVGLSTDIVVGSGDTASGMSGMELDSSDTASGSGQCRILGVSNKEDNELGTYCKWDVLFNLHELRTVDADV